MPPSMSRLPRPALTTALAVLLLVPLALAQPAPARLVITNVRVADLAAGRARPVAAIVVEGPKIVAIHQAPPATPPEAATTIDGGGATVLPGLTDLAMQALPGAALDADFFYARSLAHGVLRARAVDLRLPWAAQQRDRLGRGDILGPRLWTSGPALDLRAPLGNRTRPVLASGLSPFVQVTDAAAAVREVQRQASQGADWIRLREQVSPDAVRAVVKAARAAQVKVSLFPWATSMSQAAQAGVDLLDGLGSPVKPPAEAPPPALNLADPHAAPFAAPADPATGIAEAWAKLSPADQRTLVTQLVRARTPVAPGLYALAVLAGQDGATGDFGHLPESVRKEVATRVAAATAADRGVRQQAFARQLEFVKAFHAAGGRLVTSSGAGANGWPVPGLALHHELRWLVQAGLTPAEALRAATLGGAEVLGERLGGQLRPGAPADFFAVKGDPLADIAALSEIAFVVRNGSRLGNSK